VWQLKAMKKKKSASSEISMNMKHITVFNIHEYCDSGCIVTVQNKAIKSRGFLLENSTNRIHIFWKT
jgi:hypothetical protein